MPDPKHTPIIPKCSICADKAEYCQYTFGKHGLRTYYCSRHRTDKAAKL